MELQFKKKKITISYNIRLKKIHEKKLKNYYLYKMYFINTLKATSTDYKRL